MLANLHHRRRRNLPRAGEIGVVAYGVNQCPNRGDGGSRPLGRAMARRGQRASVVEEDGPGRTSTLQSTNASLAARSCPADWSTRIGDRSSSDNGPGASVPVRANAAVTASTKASGRSFCR
jgi:hypothetical protein